MATEKLNISGWDSGWPTGFVSNVDEPIASADGSVVSTGLARDTVIFDLTDVVDIDDAGTVTGVTITIRARQSYTIFRDGEFDVNFLIDGVSQGPGLTVDTLGTSLSNLVYVSAFWNQDWTVAQLNGAQVSVRTTNIGEVDDQTWSIDCIDVDVTYDPPLAITPDAEALALAGKVPLATTTLDHVWKAPAAETLALSGQAPTLDLSIATPVNATQLNGKPAYVNALTMQLQPNGWDSGWPTGFLANVDEPTASADGSTISTTLSGDAVTFDLDNVTGTIVDADDVLSVSVVLRAAGSAALWEEGPEPISFPANVWVEVLIGGVSQGVITQTLSASQQNYTLTDSDWDQDWTVSQLNGMQVRVTSLFGDVVVFAIDAIDVIVEYANQSPLSASPGVVTRSLTGAAPSLKYDRFIGPAAETLTLNEQTPSLLRSYNERPFEVQRRLNPKLPFRIVDFIRQPSVGGVVIDGKAETLTVNHLASPAAETLALTGQVPVSAAVADHVANPPRRELVLEPESVLVPVTNSAAFIVPRVKQYLTGKVPTASTTRHVWENPAVGGLTLSGQANSLAGSVGRTPALGTLSLGGQAPLVVRGTVLTMNNASLTLSGGQPQLGLLPDALALAGQAPTLDYTVALALGTLTLTGKAPPVVLVSATMPETGTLTLSGKVPTLGFSTQLTPGLPGLISLSVDYGIELIGTPTDIVVD